MILFHFPCIFKRDLYRLDERIPTEDVPELASILDRQWSVDPTPEKGWVTSWAVEVRPAVLKVLAELEPNMATHEEGQLTKISYLRSKEELKPYLQIEAERGSPVRRDISPKKAPGSIWATFLGLS